MILKKLNDYGFDSATYTFIQSYRAKGKSSVAYNGFEL